MAKKPLWSAFLLAVLPVALSGEVSPVGPPFRINLATAGAQVNPAIAAGANGTFVVTWASVSTGDVHARRFDAAGTPLASEFRVNTHTTGDQGRPAVAVDAAGNFVVVWESRDSLGVDYGIFGQRYNPMGSPLGAEFQVAAHTTDEQSYPDVGFDSDGNFVVVWSWWPRDGNSQSVFARWYDALGVMPGFPFQVNGYTGWHRHPRIAMAPGGYFVVAWEGERSFGDDTDVFVRRFWGDNPQGPEYRVNTYTTSPQDWPSVASAADGRFVIVWRSFYQDGSDTGVFGQRFSSSGSPEGVEFRVNTTTAGDQNRPAVASDEDGRFLVAWESYKQVFVQAFDATGSFDGAELPAGSPTLTFRNAPAVESTSAGQFVVAWDEYVIGNRDDIMARRFAPDLIFADGFDG